MAGTDCGFSTFAGFGKIDEKICYEKLHALVEGTKLASKAVSYTHLTLPTTPYV